MAAESGRGSGAGDLAAVPTRRPVPWAGLARLAAFAAVYYALIEVGRSSMPAGLYNIFRPAAGFFLAALMVAPTWSWPALVAAATAVDLASARSYPALARLTVVLPLVNSLTVTVNGALMRLAFRGRRNPLELRELTFFLALTAIASLLFATVAALLYESSEPRVDVGGFNAWRRWQVWTTANLLGVVIVTPVALSALRGRGYLAALRPPRSMGRWAEFTLQLAAVSAMSMVVFGGSAGAEFNVIHLAYVIVPLLIWIILRFDPRVSMATWMAVALLAAWSTQHGRGPFVRLGETDYERVLAAQVFLCVSTLSLLAMGAVLHDRRLKEEELARSESRYRAVVEDQTELIVRSLPDGTVTFVNGAVLRLLGSPPEEVIGARWPALLRSRERPSDATRERPTVTREGKTILPGGARVWFQWTDRALMDRDGGLIGYQSVGRDITDLKRTQEELARANDQLQVLSNQLLRAQEDERRALARELHDEVGQTLTALKVDLQRLRHRLADPESLARLDDAAAMADHALREVRELSLDLRPSVLDDFGLVAALRWYLDRQSNRAEFVGTVAAEPADLHADPAVETTCYRIVQEAVTNAVRHAGASRVEVRVWAEGGRLWLRVGDDGRGFDVAEATARASRGLSLGLLGIHERAALAGGTAEVVSEQGRGTQVLATFPLAPRGLEPVVGQEPRTETVEADEP